MVADWNLFQESDISVSNVWTSIYVKNVKKRSNISIISWKWKDQKKINPKAKNHQRIFTRLVENSSNNLAENTLHHILTKEIILTDMGIGKERENTDLVVDKIHNTEYNERCSSFRLFMDNSLTSNNSFSIILNLKVGNWFNSMLLKKTFLSKNSNKRPTKWESKNFLLFMIAQKVSLMKSSNPIQNSDSENLSSKWSKMVWELTQAKTSKKCVKNSEEKEEKLVVKRKKKKDKDVHNLKEEEENLRRRKVWINLWRSKSWKRWNPYLVKIKLLSINILSEKIRDSERKILLQNGLKIFHCDKVHLMNKKKHLKNDLDIILLKQIIYFHWISYLKCLN